MFEVSFDHRGGAKNPAFGHIGKVELDIPEDTGIMVDGKPINPDALEYLLAYGLRQAVGDAYAGAESADEAKASWAKKLDKVLSGSIGVREAGGAKVDSLHAIELSFAWEAVKKRMDKAAVKKVTALKGKERAEKMEAMWDSLPQAKRDAFHEEAVEEMERRRNRPTLDDDDLGSLDF